MIRPFRRHRQNCPHTSEIERRCKCPTYAEGKIGDERLQKTAINLSSWEAAQKWARDRESAGTLAFKQDVTLDYARGQFLADLTARAITPAPIRKFSLLLASLGTYMERKGHLEPIGARSGRNTRISGILDLGAFNPDQVRGTAQVVL